MTVNPVLETDSKGNWLQVDRKIDTVRREVPLLTGALARAEGADTPHWKPRLFDPLAFSDLCDVSELHHCWAFET